jgi:hypothetical protein
MAYSLWWLARATTLHGPVAQLDRASVFGTEGWGFDSLRGHQTAILRTKVFQIWGPQPCRVFRDRVGALTLLLSDATAKACGPKFRAAWTGQIPSHTTPTPHKQIKSFLAGISRLG